MAVGTASKLTRMGWAAVIIERQRRSSWELLLKYECCYSWGRRLFQCKKSVLRSIRSIRSALCTTGTLFAYWMEGISVCEGYLRSHLKVMEKRSTDQLISRNALDVKCKVLNSFLCLMKMQKEREKIQSFPVRSAIANTSYCSCNVNVDFYGRDLGGKSILHQC